MGDELHDGGYYNVQYENPQGKVETATFGGSAAVRIFSDAIQQEGGTTLDEQYIDPTSAP